MRRLSLSLSLFAMESSQLVAASALGDRDEKLLPAGFIRRVQRKDDHVEARVRSWKLARIQVWLDDEFESA